MNNEPFGSENQNEETNAFAQDDALKYGMFAEELPKKTDGFGIAALITGIISILCCCLYPVAWLIGVMGIVFAIISRKKMGEFTGMAIAGLVCAILGAVISAFLLGSVIFTILVSPDTFWQAFEDAYNAGLESGVSGL